MNRKIKPQFSGREKYKSAMNTFTENDFTTHQKVPIWRY